MVDPLAATRVRTLSPLSWFHPPSPLPSYLSFFTFDREPILLSHTSTKDVHSKLEGSQTSSMESTGQT